ncbi:response regulator transcription factor [Enterococcus sp. 5H]|uniref:response regulator transcription factor n=1 Tax=Enterococcus sp. 5H TaxID=1229490 RepID=UPI0023041746|nr:winged helix-turn-helix domain-containing protein [Enterococcus sp. 5H]MDA9471370.1 transcriptional regulator [Enterococcus sp. 5H]
MYTIGYLPLSTNLDKDHASALELTFRDVQIFDYDQIDLKEISQLDAIVIQDDENKFTETICELLVYVRNQSETLIWIVSEQLPKLNRKIYTKLGIDGLVGKDSEPDEVASLLLNGLKRINNRPKDHKLTVELDPNSLSVIVNDEPIRLTKSEFQLIELLHQNIENVVSYEEIRKYIWKNSVGDQQYRISNLAFLLRKKVKESAVDVITVRSKGYMLTTT